MKRVVLSLKVTKGRNKTRVGGNNLATLIAAALPLLAESFQEVKDTVAARVDNVEDIERGKILVTFDKGVPDFENERVRNMYICTALNVVFGDSWDEDDAARMQFFWHDEMSLEIRYGLR